MKQRLYFLMQFIFGVLLFQNSCFSEGSKEIYINANKSWLFMCTDNVGHCNNGGNRTPFATYGCTAPDRLYFSTLTNQETVFMGFNASIENGGASSNHVVFEIRDALGNIVYPEMNVPTTGTGFISNIGQARVGPFQIYGAGGYTAIDFHPTTPGLFYIEFAMRNNTSGAFFAGYLDMNLIDITIQDTVASVVKPGRLYSESWQYYETSNYSGTTYIYSVDSIITSCACNNMTGGIWVQFCNQWGCANTGNFVQDRKSTNTQSLLPEFKIFLNNPDITLYPPATTLGQIVPPQPSGVQDCNTGHITFTVNVNKPGSVEIDLSFAGSYVTRVLNQVVSIGTNTIIWDGLDGTTPVGVPVPNGVNVTFTVKYINGLTNLPFFDIEGNPNGFTVALVNPPGAEPLLYWDDSNLGGGWGTNFTGCSNPPGGCHTWPYANGDGKTVNTWWYNVSATTSPVNIIQFRHAGTLTYVQAPQTVCAGSTGHVFSVNQDVNTTIYHWSYTGVGATIHQANPSDYFVNVDFAPNATSGNLVVYGTNTNCTNPGPSTSLAITISPVPVLNPPTPNSICTGVLTNITLTSVPASTTFDWMSTPPTCSANIVSCPPGSAGFNLITDILTLSNNNPGTVTYHVISTLNGCNSTPQDFILTVLPSPVPVITGSASVCPGSTGVVYSTSAGMTGYTWSVSSGGTITSGAGTNSIAVSWNTIGPQTVSVSYTDGNSCVALTPTVFNVTVNTLPSPTINGPVSACEGSTGNVYSTLPGMSNYVWNVTGGTITSGGTTNDNTATITWNIPGSQTVSLLYTDANLCTAATPAVYPVTVNTLPIPIISGASGMCLNSTGPYTTTSGMTGYTWTVSSGGNIVSGIGTNTIDITWTSNGTKTITLNYTDANGCTATSPSTYTVTVNTLPVPGLFGSNNICKGFTTTYKTEAWMNNYSWTVTAGGTIESGGGSSDSTMTVIWNTAGNDTVSVNYFTGPSCTGITPTTLPVIVKPLPAVTNAANSTICSGVTTSIPLQSSPPLSTFTWTATGSSGNVTGFSASGGQTITQTLSNSGNNLETVNYTVTPHLNGCDGTPVHYIVTVDPVADVVFTPNGQTICSGATTNITLSSPVAGATFTWTASNISGNVTGFTPGNDSTITQTLTSIGTGHETVTYTVTATLNTCTGQTKSVAVIVNPLPPVILTTCYDPVTTTAAQPFALKGGVPLGGTYSGAGISAGIFNPSIAGIGTHPITYSVTNTWGCSANATQTIAVVNPPVFQCGNPITDIRDGKQYATVKIATQCWMAENLNYGTQIPVISMQRDNCIPEKFCYSDNPGNCVSYGGLYQWDEMMQYNTAEASQGFCMPGWHVPTNNEWTTLFNVYISNGFAGSPLKSTGYSGFNALLSGAFHDNISWDFPNFAAMLWSSTVESPLKAWAHGMNFYNPSVSYYPSSQTHAFSLRCMKD
jgi:uncharacterized protein (TIGR02145 family)